MKKVLIVVLALMVIACNNKTEDAHAHNQDGSHVGEEIPKMDFTIWTDQTELFVEFPALIVGNPSKFAAHFTVMDKHQPVTEGSVTVSLVSGEKGIRASVDKPSSPGIFSPVLKPLTAGKYQVIFELSTPQYKDKIIIKEVTVFTNLEEATKTLGTTTKEAPISFLKEQAWKIDFQTATVMKGIIYDVINTHGVWMPSPSSVASLAAKSNGVVEFKLNNLTEGMAIKKGQVLMSINSQGLTANNLNTEIARAKAIFEQTKAEYDRKKQLFDAKIVPKSEFEKVTSNFEIAKANYQSLIADVSSGSKQIRAPFDGYIKSISVSNGNYVEQGVTLLTMGSQQSKVLKSQLAPTYGLSMNTIKGIWYQSNKGQWINITDDGGKILAVSKAVDKENPLLAVFAEINSVEDLPDGSLSPVQITMGNATQNALIPINALLEDYGSYSVIVQLSGESFERRQVKIGKRNGENVEILHGLKAGEVVVTTGAYQVKMASMSGSTPAHGHEH
jgi:RND family efflux transporter MFP subunit